MSQNWYQGLNPEQAKAVAHNQGPLLILAGAGSGKTTVLVSRTGRLIADKIVPAKNICVLTFTNKAAKEMKHRVQLKLGHLSKGLWAGTFHSFGLGLIRKNHKKFKLSPQFGILDSGDSQAIIKDLLKDLKNSTKDKFDTEKLLSHINELRTNKKFKVELEDEYQEMATVLKPKYENKLRLLGVVDFEDLLLKPFELFQEYPDVLSEVQDSIQQLMVDEFQDTNHLQMKLINKIVQHHKNITVVGDDDQSIYGWRGAEVSNILDFPRLYTPCEVIKLERNYRSTPAILTVANQVISQNKQRHGKILKSEQEMPGDQPEVFVYDSEEDEAENVATHIQHFLQKGFKYKNIAILYRSNSQGGFVEAYLRRAQIPYSLTGGTAFFDRKEIKDILAYLRASLSPHEVALRRVINSPSRGIGDVSIEKISEFSIENKITFMEAMQRWKECEVQEHIGEKIDELILFLDNFAERIILGADYKSNKTRRDSQLVTQAKQADTPIVDTQMSFIDREPQTSFSNKKVDSIAHPIKSEPFAHQFTSSQKPSSEMTAGETLIKILTDIGYRSFVYNSVSEAHIAEKKWMFVEIFARVMDSFMDKGGRSIQTLKEFIDCMELRDQIEESLHGEEANLVQLLTFHACKGLEFPVCLMVGLEEDIIPHRTLGLNIDEERRLFYVGVTRAQKHLVMTRARQRKRHGSLKPTAPSRFLLEIPDTMYKIFESGFRSVTENQRNQMFSDFMKKLEVKDPVK